MKQDKNNTTRGRIINSDIQKEIQIKKKEGLSNRRISDELDISPSTVAKYIK